MSGSFHPNVFCPGQDLETFVWMQAKVWWVWLPDGLVKRKTDAHTWAVDCMRIPRREPGTVLAMVPDLHREGDCWMDRLAEDLAAVLEKKQKKHLTLMKRKTWKQVSAEGRAPGMLCKEKSCHLFLGLIV